MALYMLRDGVTEGNIARIMGCHINEILRISVALGEFRSAEAAERKRRQDRMRRAAERHQKKYGQRAAA